MRAIFLVSTDSYIEKAKCTIASILEKNNDLKIFLYLINSKKEYVDLNLIKNLEIIRIQEVLSEETSKKRGRKIYSELMAYSANFRIKAFLNLIKKDYKEILYCDCDSIILKDIDFIFNNFKETDVSFKLRVGGSKTKSVLSGIIYIRNTKISKLFLKDVYKNIIKNGEMNWYSDQISLYQSYKVFKKRKGFRFKNLDSKYIDWEHNADSFIWVQKGSQVSDDFISLQKKYINMIN